MEFVEIVFDRPLPPDVDRDDVEDDLSEALGDLGEITGAGSGFNSSNLDLDVAPGADKVEVLRIVFHVLSDLKIGDAVRVRPGDGDIWIRPSEWNQT